jgi:peptidoglycan biosynthesis protein MviN/MurJ (putative lipid II flippase)
MSIHEWYYLPVGAIIGSLFQYFWMTKIAHKEVKGAQIIGLIFLGAFLTTWGIDVLQKTLDVSNLEHILKVSLGCWLMFAAASASKHYALNGWSKRKFWLDYGGDLFAFVLMGLVVYVLT